ncbi:PEP-CTERM sorting domain-containing protein [Luteolibacter flavescens]|uniref:PEP-CTERM sorting domain-containing protein n=1 Tax=Luteolibacter flavescens TaxID=1859460 RepID=A0ABT3FRB9_9BACT|nr:PEP-CTERM sorting domain-containing protein [Luteolibacter flavescens]MCW1886118.1 PEP-CTERM sorting domain-containing protein [Luteolibacter flavescens]
MTARLTLIAAAALMANAGAATVIPNYENPGPDGDPFLYLDKVTMSSTDSWTDSETVGAWSFRDLRTTVNPNRGWGHFATWYLIELTSAVQVTISMSSSDPAAWAGFAIYAGESVNDDPGMAHSFSNNGLEIAALNGGWDKNGPDGTTGLTYVGNGHSTTTQSGTATGTWTLGPGLYSVVFGNAADSSDLPPDIDYDFSIVTTIPEPSTALLAALASGLLVLRRRRSH